MSEPSLTDLLQQGLSALRRLHDSAADVHDAIAGLTERLRAADTWLLWIVVVLAGMTIVQVLTLLTVASR